MSEQGTLTTKKIQWLSDRADALLESGTMSTDKKFRYYIGFLFLSVVFTEFIMLVPSESPLEVSDVVSAALYSIVTILFAYFFYKRYTGNASFIEKSIILSVAIIPKFSLYSLPVFFVFMFSSEYFVSVGYQVWFDVTFFTIWLVFYYSLLTKYFITKTVK